MAEAVTQPTTRPGAGPEPAPVAGPRDSSTLVEVIPVLEERATITKRAVESVRAVIHKTVSERDEVVEALLNRRDVTVERVPVGRMVEAVPAPRQDGDVWILPIMDEILVVEKRLVLKEELHIRTVTRQETVQETVRLRTEHVAIDTAAQPSTKETPI